ncbi:MAG: TlpA family protein disulfide reductase [Chitinophagaceae bacterium]|nr:MAG: TlpA family protein disulfide reductase [Chitinophagaceae bacterium]
MRLFSSKIILYPAFWLLWMGISSVKRPPRANVVSGMIKGLSGPTVQLVWEEDINRKKESVLADLPVDAGGSFRFERDLAPGIYRLQVSQDRSVRMAIDHGQQLLITGAAGGTLQVTGSEDTEALHAYESYRTNSLQRLVLPVRAQIKMLEGQGRTAGDRQFDSLVALEMTSYEQHKNELIAYAELQMGTSVAIYATSIRWDGERNLPALSVLAQRFALAHPNTQVAALVEEKVRIIASNRVGAKAPDIKLPDQHGAAVWLSSIHARYILVDFWASWCLPCRRERTQLGELYKTFHSKGFEIYAVGLESRKESWLHAIESDQRTWIHVSALQQFETPAAFDYSVSSLPSNVLLDSAGTIIARNLHGRDLERKLEALFAK